MATTPFNKQTEKLIRSAVEAMAVDVVCGRTWQYENEECLITEVWRGKPTRAWTYSMLHEVGHHLIMRNSASKRKYWKIDSDHIDDDSLDRIGAVQRMKEEMEAWDRGFDWAKRLGLELDRKDYDKYSAKFLMEYMRHFATF